MNSPLSCRPWILCWDEQILVKSKYHSKINFFSWNQKPNIFWFSLFHKNIVAVTNNVNLFNCWHSYIFKGKLIKTILKLWVLLFLRLFFLNASAVQIFLKKMEFFFLLFLHNFCIKKKHDYSLVVRWFWVKFNIRNSDKMIWIETTTY